MAGMPPQKPKRRKPKAKSQKPKAKSWKAGKLERCSRTICLPIDEPLYREVISNVTLFRPWLAGQHELDPEQFPGDFAAGFSMKDRCRTSARLGIKIHRVTLRDGSD